MCRQINLVHKSGKAFLHVVMNFKHFINDGEFFKKLEVCEFLKQVSILLR